ncbi:DUF2062 domain-containing protein [Rhodobacter ferrooxidans]|uniref:DUF2062 domain-containing protein n=1 Tax=Rhodobacter ferrooxidans TaxID=371731 RepID=C8S2I4_9RHOB|nr:DUF2062 domain-containing protein [Rhodobacter sp. SW2]EEW24855.1 conserved hypothetical protein [Rhodobacter sp. SW2]
MVFKRRNPRTWPEAAREFVYPRGGIWRAVLYVLHRMRRLPDKPHRIARGVFAGTFVNFPPVYGVQMLSAALLAWGMRGNIVAALLCTFLSNPITTPFIATGSLELGHWMLGIEAPLDFLTVYAAFSDASVQLWHNFWAMFSRQDAEWDKLIEFFHFIFWPYVIGSILPGLVAATVAYYISLPLIHAYQKIRHVKFREQVEKRRRLRQAMAEAELRKHAQALASEDDAAGTP